MLRNEWSEEKKLVLAIFCDLNRFQADQTETSFVVLNVLFSFLYLLIVMLKRNTKSFFGAGFNCLKTSGSIFYFASNLLLYLCFGSTDSTDSFFIDISSCSDKLITRAFFPLLGVNPKAVLHLKERPHRIHHRLNRTMVKMMKKKENEEKSQLKKTLPGLGLEPTNSVSGIELVIHWTTVPCLTLCY